MPNERVELIPVKIIFQPYLLMRLVNKKSLAYLELRDSIKDFGLINSICVRPSNRQEDRYEIVDGMKRWLCYKDLELEFIPAIIVEADDAEVLRIQLQANAIKQMTKPVSFANQMKRIFMADPKMTFAGLSKDIRKSPAWIKKMLGLLNLISEIGKRVDRGEIPITSAYMLAKLPKWMQVDLEEDAIVKPANEFSRFCSEQLRGYKSKRVEERVGNFYKTHFEPHPYLQFYRVIVAEHKHQLLGPVLLVKNNITKPLDAWNLALAWVLHLDPDSMVAQIKRAQDKFQEQQVKIANRTADRRDRQDDELIQQLPIQESLNEES